MQNIKGKFFTPNIIIATVIVIIFLCCLTNLVLQLIKLPFISTSINKAWVTVLPASTETSLPLLGADSNMETQQPPESISGLFAVGMKVKVARTDGDGLRMRSNAGLDFNVIHLAQENQEFIINNGPTIADGYVWWEIRSLNDTITGWAVQDFLDISSQ